MNDNTRVVAMATKEDFRLRTRSSNEVLNLSFLIKNQVLYLYIFAFIITEYDHL